MLKTIVVNLVGNDNGLNLSQEKKRRKQIWEADMIWCETNLGSGQFDVKKQYEGKEEGENHSLAYILF